MATLIVTRPRLGGSWDRVRTFDVLIDGKAAAKIAIGETIDIELPSGPHELRVRTNRAQSRPVVVTPAPEQTVRLAVGHGAGFRKALIGSVILSSLPFLGLVAWGALDAGALATPGGRGGTVSSHVYWQMLFLTPALTLVVLVLLAFSTFLRDQALVLIEIPTTDVSDQQAAELVRALRFRVRIAIRHLMLAVAILALVFWRSLEQTRSAIGSNLRLKAGVHAKSEESFRGLERGWLDIQAKASPSALFKQQVARAAARADYHAALKRKYEHAAAEGRFFVEPNAPEPTWP